MDCRIEFYAFTLPRNHCLSSVGLPARKNVGQSKEVGLGRTAQIYNNSAAWGRSPTSLQVRSDLVSTGRANSVLFGINGVRNKRSHLVGPPFPEFEARFSATAGWHFSSDLTRRLVIGGCGHRHVSVKYG